MFGNHNLKEFYLYHKNAVTTAQQNAVNMYDMSNSHGALYLGFRTAREKNILLAGLSGSMKYNNGLNQYTESQMFFKICRLIPRLIYNKIRYGRYLDILVTHAAPQGIHDRDDPCHRGFRCFLWFMKKFTPSYLIHGHIHLYDMQDVRVSRYEKTTVINAYSHYILDYDEGDSCQ